MRGATPQTVLSACRWNGTVLRFIHATVKRANPSGVRILSARIRQNPRNFRGMEVLSAPTAEAMHCSCIGRLTETSWRWPQRGLAVHEASQQACLKLGEVHGGEFLYDLRLLSPTACFPWSCVSTASSLRITPRTRLLCIARRYSRGFQPALGQMRSPVSACRLSMSRKPLSQPFAGLEWTSAGRVLPCDACA